MAGIEHDDFGGIASEVFPGTEDRIHESRRVNAMNSTRGQHRRVERRLQPDFDALEPDAPPVVSEIQRMARARDGDPPGGIRAGRRAIDFRQIADGNPIVRPEGRRRRGPPQRRSAETQQNGACGQPRKAKVHARPCAEKRNGLQDQSRRPINPCVFRRGRAVLLRERRGIQEFDMAEVTLDEVPRKMRESFDKAASALERGNSEYAEGMLMALLEQEPRLLQARKLLRAAQIKRQKGKGGGFARVLSSLTQMPAVLPINAAISKDPLKALPKIERLLAKDATNPSYCSLLIKAAEAAGLREIGIHTLELMLERKPDDVNLLNWIARLHDEEGNTQEARKYYERVVELRPNDPAAIKALKDAQARETMKQGRWEEVKQAGDFRKVIKDAAKAEILEKQAKAVKTADDAEQLIEELRANIEREPGNINYRRALADHLLRLNRFDEALAALREADEISGGGDPQIDRAINAATLRRFDAEIAALRSAGRTAEAGEKERERDRFTVEDAARRVARYPNDLQIKYEYGVLLYEHERYTEAIAQFQAAQRNPQRRLRALYYLALCFEKKGQVDIAIEQLEKAASEMTLMDDNRKDVLYELGALHEKLGQPEKALEYYKEIYAVDISYRDVAQKVERRPVR